MALNHDQLLLNPQASAALNGALYGCPDLINGTCQGGVPWRNGPFPSRLGAIPGTNILPRTSVGPQITAMLPIINAPVRVYFAFNPNRLASERGFEHPVRSQLSSRQEKQETLPIEEALANYGAKYFLWEPRKTLRVSVSTSF